MTGVQTCALPIWQRWVRKKRAGRSRPAWPREEERRREERERKDKGKKKRKKRKRRGERERRGKRKREEVEGHFRETTKMEEGGCKKAGVGKENYQGISRVWRLGGLWAGLGYSLARSNLFFSFAN